MKELDILPNLKQIIESSKLVFKDSQGQFRTSAVVFFDLCGSTEIKSKSGHFRGAKAALIHNDICKKVTEICHGRHIKDLGDGSISQFREPLQAIKAMVNTRVAMGIAGLQTKIGAAFGTVEEINLENFDIIGETVDKAARIADACLPDQILIDNALETAVSSILRGISFASLGKPTYKNLKGLEPLKLFEVMSPHFSSQVQAPKKSLTDKNYSGIIQLIESFQSQRTGIELEKGFECISKVVDIIKDGKIPLSPLDYYNEIHREIESATSSSIIFATASLSLTEWLNSDHQSNYFWKNIEAIQRGVRIERLFVYSDKIEQDIEKRIQLQVDEGIVARKYNAATTHILENLSDMVIFGDSSRGPFRCYLSLQTEDIPGSKVDTYAIYNQELIMKKINIFRRYWNIAYKIESRNRNPFVIPKKHYTHGKLKTEVVSCIAAASAKKIPLDQELKTMILETDSNHGVCAVHIPGDMKLSLRKVKRFLKCKQAKLASPITLEQIGCHPGSVCAFKKNIWDLRTLVCDSVLNKNFVSTNDGTLKGFIKFPPSLLLSNTRATVGSFSKTPN